MAAAGVPCLEVDSGLDYLIALLQFMHNTCVEAVCKYLVHEFKNCRYLRESSDTCVKPKMKLLEFLKHVNQKFSDKQKNPKKCENKQKLQQKPYPHCHQQKYHTPHKHRQAAGSTATATPSQAQHTVQNSPQDPHDNRRTKLITDIDKNEEILSQVTMDDFKDERQDVCPVLCRLDLNFILNIILNIHIDFRLNEELKKACYKMKDVRKILVHMKFHFSEEDFINNLDALVEATEVFYRELHLPDQDLWQRADMCRQEGKSGSKIRSIFKELVFEAHNQYSSPQPGIIFPNITSKRVGGHYVIEDLVKFITEQQEHERQVLLCGEQRIEKKLLLHSLAHTLTKDSNTAGCRRFRLVLYLDDSGRRNWHQQIRWPKGAMDVSLEFQQQIFGCLANLVPDTVCRYGADAVKAAIKTYQKDILFLINWNINVLGPIRGEMQHGTWFLTYQGKSPSVVDWQILELEPYTETQVVQVLQNLNSHGRFKDSHTDILRVYHNFSDKHILSSLDMILIFNEVSMDVSTDTDFQVVSEYVTHMMKCNDNPEEIILKLGEAAFTALLNNRCMYEGKDLGDVKDDVLETFLSCTGGKKWRFCHDVVQDFMAAKYVVSRPTIACKKWLRDDNNVAAFKRVFKFVCSMWFDERHITDDKLKYMKEFLRSLWVGKREIRERTREEPMEVDKKTGKKKKKQGSLGSEEVHKCPFKHWEFLLQLEEACHGKRDALNLLASIISDIPCWCIVADDHLSRKLTRLEIVLKKVILKKEAPVIIKLKSDSNTAILTKLWKKLQCVGTLHGRVNVMITVDMDDTGHIAYRERLEELLTAIANTQQSLYISRYKGPLFCSHLPNLLQCVCLRHLEVLEVNLYDVKSLYEVMACEELPRLKEIFVMIDLKLSEQAHLVPYSIELPGTVTLNITIKYFPNVQQLLNSFKNCHHLCSLSIHGLFICKDFKLDLSEFKELESLNLRCEPECSREMFIEGGMEVEMEVTGERQPRQWWLQELLHLILPKRLDRLLLRNMEFFDDSKHGLLETFFCKSSINKLMILDTKLSLLGVEKILCTQTDSGGEGCDTRKRIRTEESLDIQALIAKRPRLSKKERETRKRKKPPGKEIVITSEAQLCSGCDCFPCLCTEKVGCENLDQLISDLYNHDIVSFSYSLKQCTIRMDVCGDLHVKFAVKSLNDDTLNMHFEKLFIPLTLAQTIALEETSLSPDGVETVVKHIQNIKSRVCQEGRVDPFSLTISTLWHAQNYGDMLQGIIDFLSVDYISVAHYWCMCMPVCFHVRKTYRGEILLTGSKISSKSGSAHDHRWI